MADCMFDAGTYGTRNLSHPELPELVGKNSSANNVDPFMAIVSENLSSQFKINPHDWSVRSVDNLPMKMNKISRINC